MKIKEIIDKPYKNVVNEFENQFYSIYKDYNKKLLNLYGNKKVLAITLKGGSISGIVKDIKIIRMSGEFVLDISFSHGDNIFSDGRIQIL